MCLIPCYSHACQVNVYLQNSLHLDYGSPSARTVDLTGDGKTVVVVLASGALQVFSWQGQVRPGIAFATSGGDGDICLSRCLRLWGIHGNQLTCIQ